MLAYVLFIAIVNTSLGFGVAIYAGRKYQTLKNPKAPAAIPGGFSNSQMPMKSPPDTSSENLLSDLAPDEDDSADIESSSEPSIKEEATDIQESAEEDAELPPSAEVEPENDVEEEAKGSDSPAFATEEGEEADDRESKSETAELASEDTPEDSELNQMAELLGQPLESDEAAEGTPEEAPGTEVDDTTASSEDEDIESELTESDSTESENSEAAVDSFKDQVIRFQEDLSNLDSQLLASIEDEDIGGIEAHLVSLREANSVQLGSCEELRKNLDEFEREMQNLNAMGDKLMVAVEMEEQQIAGTTDVIASVETDSENKEACRQIREEASKLSTVNHHLRDTTQETLAAMVRDQEKLATLDPAEHIDPQTGVLDRIGLEIVLHHDWPNAEAGPNQLGVAMVDIDQFTQLNDRFGRAMGDRILKAIAGLLTSSIRDEYTVGRHAGQRFMLIFPECDREAVVAETERLRQTVELTHLKYENHEYPVTVSCAVTVVTTADSPDSLESRLTATMAEAKRYGRNRTFVHEGKCPRPVPSGTFDLEERTVMI